MVSSYPVEYRTRGRPIPRPSRRPGIQRPGRIPPPRRSPRIPTRPPSRPGPFRRSPSPWKRPTRVPLPPIPKPWLKPVLMSGVSRVIPYIGVAITLYEAWELWQWLEGAEGPNYDGYEVIHECRTWDGFGWNPLNSSYTCSSSNWVSKADYENPLINPRPGSPVGSPAYFTLVNKNTEVSTAYEFNYAATFKRVVDGAPAWVPGVAIPWAPVFPYEMPWPLPEPNPNTPSRPAPKPRPEEQPSRDSRDDPDPPGKDRDWPKWRIPPQPFPLVTIPGVTPGYGGPEPAPDTVGQDIPPSGPPTTWKAPGPGGPSKRRPKRREKEKKVTVRTVSGAAWGVINLVTEGIELVDVFWNGLPKKYRSDCDTPQCKAWDVYNNFDKLDVAETLQNYVNNNIEDALYGMKGQAIGRASRGIGHSTGLSHADRASTSYQEAPELPEIDIDIEYGSVTLKVPGGYEVGARVDMYGGTVFDNKGHAMGT